MPLSVGHWCSLPGVLYTGNTATTHSYTHMHTDIYTCVDANDFTSSSCTGRTKGNETSLWTSVPPTHTQGRVRRLQTQPSIRLDKVSIFIPTWLLIMK